MAVPTETQSGGCEGYPVEIKIFDPRETAKRALDGCFTDEIREQIEVGSELLPAARRGEFDCLLCRKPFHSLPALAGWLETPGGTRRAAFGVCQSCDGPDVKERLLERLGAVKMGIH
jgi:hypothetical protein